MQEIPHKIRAVIWAKIPAVLLCSNFISHNYDRKCIKIWGASLAAKFKIFGKGKLATQTQINFRMTRNQELDLLQSAELKQAFDEFDKVENMMGYIIILN